jgi:hypothetical protein
MRYLVVGSGGPGFASAKEALEILSNIVLPNFSQLIELEKKRKIIAGGLPVGSRSFVFIVEAESNGELDKMLRQLPMWGTLDWEVTPLQTFNERAKEEQQVVEDIRKTIKKK